MKVFKYRDGDDAIFSRDLEALEQDWFWAPTRDKLNDPCEGMVSHEMLVEQLELITKTFGGNNTNVQLKFEKFKQSLDSMFKHKDTSGVYSLSQTPIYELL